MVHSEDIPSLATGPSDAYWRAARKCLLHSFGPAQLSHVLAVARSKAAATAGVLGALGPGVVVDMADVAGRYSLDVLMLGQLGYSVKVGGREGGKEGESGVCDWIAASMWGRDKMWMGQDYAYKV